MNKAPYDLVVAGPAVRAITERLSEAVAAAVIDFINGPLVGAPVSGRRRPPSRLEGTDAARRGTFRVLYRIEEESRTVIVLRIDHRADVYRS